MKKIWWLIQQLESIGGTEMVSTQIMNELCGDYQVNLVCLGEKPKSCPYGIDERINVHYLNIKRKYVKIDEYLSDLLNRRKYLGFIVTLFQAAGFWGIRRFRYRKKIKRMTGKDDIIVASSLDNYMISPRGRKVFFHYHFNAKFFFTFSASLGWLFCRRPDKWIFITETTRKQVVERKPDIKEKAAMIYNPTRFERNLDVTFKNRNLIFIGRYVAQKRPLLAIEMAYHLKKLMPDFKLRFFGDGPLREKMKSLIREKGLEDNIYVNGVNPGIIEEIRKSDLLIMTSDYEGFALVILEANSQSVPCLTTYWGEATSEIVQDGKNGFVFMDDDIEAMADKIHELLTDTNALEELKASSYEYVGLFTKETIIRKWLKLFSEE